MACIMYIEIFNLKKTRNRTLQIGQKLGEHKEAKSAYYSIKEVVIKCLTYIPKLLQNNTYRRMKR